MKFCSDNLTALLGEGAEQLTFYLNKPNKRGWGVIYLRLRLGSSLLRLSTSIKVKPQYWRAEEGRVILPLHISEIDRRLHASADEMLNSVKDLVMSEIISIFAMPERQKGQSEAIHALRAAIDNIKKATTMAREQKPSEALTLLLDKEVFKIDNSKTLIENKGMVSNFKKFLTSVQIPDSIESANQQTMKRYLAWLKDSKNGICISRGKNCFNCIFRLLRNIEVEHGYDFKLDRKIADGYKETRSMEERRNNNIALTLEEIDKIKALKLEGKLSVVRDIFLLQCYCGFRFEDLPLLLDSKNLKETEGVKYAVFETQKRGITSQTPLSHKDYFPEALEIYERYKDKSPFCYKNTNAYNRGIKQIAKMANLDREITLTSTMGTKKLKHVVKLYDKISSHSARHTFITNCVRYKHISPNTLKYITGHSDNRLIQSVYSNLQEEDKLNIVHSVGTNDNNSTSPTNTNYGINGIREAKSVLQYLGIDYNDSMSFEELVRLIETEQYNIKDKYGIDITLLKDIFNLSSPMQTRIKALKGLLGGLLAS